MSYERTDETTYRGRRPPNQAGPCAVEVLADGSAEKRWLRLRPRNDLRNHSPDGFQWGYAGSGPAQLALALLADCTNDAFAQQRYQQFKFDVVARLPDEWTLTAGEIRERVGWKAAA